MTDSAGELSPKDVERWLIEALTEATEFSRKYKESQKISVIELLQPMDI